MWVVERRIAPWTQPSGDVACGGAGCYPTGPAPGRRPWGGRAAEGSTTAADGWGSEIGGKLQGATAPAGPREPLQGWCQTAGLFRAARSAVPGRLPERAVLPQLAGGVRRPGAVQ